MLCKTKLILIDYRSLLVISESILKTQARKYQLPS